MNNYPHAYRWVTIQLAEKLIGWSAAAMRAKIRAGKWRAGREWTRPRTA